MAKKRKLDVTFNSMLLKDSEASLYYGLRTALRGTEAFKDDETLIRCIKDPFTCCVIPNFISDGDFALQLKEELLSLNFHEKSNDLYKFKQSDDLKESQLPAVSVFRDLLYHDFLTWLKEAAGKELKETIDMSCAKYEATDTLLCHDDRLEDRCIAFIYYLVPPWTKEDGGTLDLFSVDAKGQPSKIAHSLVPSSNTLIFFEVSEKSFHQVAEVLSTTKCRLSVSGWFHGNVKSISSPSKEVKRHFEPALEMKDEILIKWVNPMYLNPEVVCSIQERFEEENEILLQDFLLEDQYKVVELELASLDLHWSLLGPPNKRCYKRAESLDSSPTLRDLTKFLGSRPMFKLLTKLTGLDLAEIPELRDDDDDEEESSPDLGGESLKNPRSFSEVRRWSHGSYTLLNDEIADEADYALDSVLYFNCSNWDTQCGGYTSYVSKDQDEELLTIEPSSNCLALIYSDPETLHFVKHINSRCLTSCAGSVESNNCFYDIATVYLE